jgi:uncharacterized lipoprotein YmbA
MKHKLSSKRLVIVSVFLLLSAGCIPIPRSPSPRFYVLQSIKEPGNIAIADAGSLNDFVVGIGPITLPEYFNRPQIVTNNNDDTIEYAQFDRWAESLDAAIVRIIGQNISILAPKINVEIFPWNSVIPVRYQVIMEVVELDCRFNAQAALFMQWSVLDAQKKVLLTKRSEYRNPIGSRNYAGLVKALSVICESASREITAALAELEKKSPYVLQQ